MTMKDHAFRSTLLPLVIIPAGGLLALGSCYLLYLFIYNTVEARFFPTNPTAVPADAMRRVYALALLVLYGAVLRAKISDLLKATLLVGPLGIVVTTAILAFYQKPAAAVAAVGLILAACVTLLYRLRKPWFYYYALATTVLAAIALAWPRA